MIVAVATTKGRLFAGAKLGAVDRHDEHHAIATTVADVSHQTGGCEPSDIDGSHTTVV